MLHPAVEIVAGVLLLAGAVFAVIGGIGLLRLPDLFSRMHGAGVTDTMGAGLLLLGLMLHAGLSLATFKLVFVLFFMLVASPTSTHALAKAALAHGLEPRTADEEDGSSPT